MESNRLARIVLLLTGLYGAGPALAVGTVAGTDISNTADVSYEILGTPVSATSNTLVVTVAEILDVDVTLR